MSVSATTQRAADRTEPWGHRLKKVAIPCRSGAPCGWIKVKCPSWRALNSDTNGASLKAPSACPIGNTQLAAAMVAFGLEKLFAKWNEP